MIRKTSEFLRGRIACDLSSAGGYRNYTIMLLKMSFSFEDHPNGTMSLFTLLIRIVDEFFQKP